LKFLVKESFGDLIGPEALALCRNWLALEKERSFFVIAPNDRYAYDLGLSLNSLLSSGEDKMGHGESPVVIFPSWDTMPFDSRSPDALIVAERLRALHSLLKLQRQNISSITITSIPSLFQKIVSPKHFNSQCLSLSVGEMKSRLDLLESLEWLGYRRVIEVEDIGQYSDKGAIVDLFSPSSIEPCRIQFFGSEIDSLRSFTCEDQRSHATLEKYEILPVREFGLSFNSKENDIKEKLIPRLKLLTEEASIPSSELRSYEQGLMKGLIWAGAEGVSNFIFSDHGSIQDYLNPNSLHFFVGDISIKSYLETWEESIEKQYEKAREKGLLIGPKDSVCHTREELEALTLHKLINIRSSESSLRSETVLSKDQSFYLESPPSIYFSDLAKDQKSDVFQRLSDRLKSLLKENFRIILALPSEEKRMKVFELLKGRDLPVVLASKSILDEIPFLKPRELLCVVSALRSGVFDADAQLIIFSEKEIFPSTNRILSRRLPFKRSPFRRAMSSLSQLLTGDFVVHEQYGIGSFQGLRAMNLRGVFGEFLDIEYEGGAKLYVPVHDFSKVGKYSGADGKPPALTKLGTGSWEQTKAKIKRTIAELTASLLKTMAVRKLVKGIDFGPLNPEDEWFANLFPYQETPDQERTIKEVLSDMGSDKPMDRLVCGDVGFGKTEVALRAAFKACTNGKQVAILVPTTILAEQHFRTFEDRFKSTPIKVSSISRFKSPKENKMVLTEVLDGKIDIIIGTHRLLQSDVVFHDLGLIVIDEEHRFGVSHKERLKRLRAEVDVLSLSATPIPRSLQMALFGTRDLSVIETAPFDRQAVHTEVLPYREDIVEDAIARELSRDGQVFVVHHFIEGLEEISASIQKRFPGIGVELVHGRLSKIELEKRMHEFYSGRSKILVATSIIESGIDIPNANTMIIIKAEQFGLAQLYQLRGRVGRSSRKGYAYLCHSDKNKLTEDAKRRLQAMSSIDELGLGFKLAMQDMEIRGAGSMFGKDQSGHVQLLGYDMYCKVLEDAVSSEKRRRGMDTGDRGIQKFPDFEPELILPGDAFIPEQFIPDMSSRLLIYQQTLEISSSEKAELFFEEITDRYGSIPIELNNLVNNMLIRNHCKKLGIHKLIMKDNYCRIYLLKTKEAPDTRLKLFSSLRESIKVSDLLVSFVFGEGEDLILTRLENDLANIIKLIKVEA